MIKSFTNTNIFFLFHLVFTVWGCFLFVWVFLLSNPTYKLIVDMWEMCTDDVAGIAYILVNRILQSVLAALESQNICLDF